MLPLLANSDSVVSGMTVTEIAGYGALAFVVVLAIVACVVVAVRKKKPQQHPETDAEYTVQPPIQKPAQPPIRQTGMPEPAVGPRRAVSLPVADSDSQRASEQTLKRMTLDQLDSSRDEDKGPRAGEVPENPILPDEVVKIRCLACDKKMKAEGTKFMRQRRCPNCKAAPFRYVTAV